MKTIIKNLALSAVLVGSLTSCNDFLTVTPTDKLTMDNFYTDASMVRSQTLGLYSAIIWGNVYMNFNWKLDMLNGDMYYTYDAEGQWFFGTYTTVNQYLNEGWEGLYTVIAQCNSVINDMPGCCSSGVSQEDINKAVAEARCIRGYCYYMLAELWHDVPIVYDNSKNIADANLDLPRNTQKSVYQFALEDLDYAVATLPESDSDSFRCTQVTAHSFRAKLLVTMASHSDYGYDRAALYSQAAEDALYAVEHRTNIKNIDFSTLFDVEANNGPESIFAIQCFVGGYAYGNPKNCAWSRSSVIADQTWGGGKGPTISAQKMYDQLDQRRKWTYMTNGDYYPNLNKANGGYTYKLVSFDPEDPSVQIEGRIEMNAHIKKYVIGKAADCDNNVGLSQDAANNIYMMRLADMYLTYTEAVMGTNDQTSDGRALDMFNSVRARAGLAGVSSVTFKDLLKERRREFLFESVNWFDILRYRYRSGDAAALEFVNSGYETGYNRSSMYIPKDWSISSDAELNDNNSYIIVDNKADGGQYDHIDLSASSFILPIPAAVSTSSPALAGDPVDFYAN
jgi:hypothetical protein